MLYLIIAAALYPFLLCACILYTKYGSLSYDFERDFFRYGLPIIAAAGWPCAALVGIGLAMFKLVDGFISNRKRQQQLNQLRQQELEHIYQKIDREIQERLREVAK